jgi:hypothetical protein
MSMISMVVGATTDTSARFVTKVDNGPVRIAYSTDPGMASPSLSGSEAVDGDGVAIVEVTGLTAGTRYFWQVEDDSVLDTGTTGTFLTHPVAAGDAASYTLLCVGDAGQFPLWPGEAGGELDAGRVSNHPAFSTVLNQALARDWLMCVNLGDWGYPDWGGDLADSVANRRAFFDDQLAQPRQAPLWRSLPSVYVWDDHDYADDNSDGTYPDKANAAQVYRERWPHYDLAESTGPIYHSFQIGRVLYVVSDARYERTPNGATDNSAKTMLGSAQKAWLDGVLDNNNAKALVWLMPTPWIGTGSDNWASFTTERAELVDLLDGHGWLDRMVMVTADVHTLALESGQGGNANRGGFPIMLCAALDARPTATSGNQYDTHFQPGRNQYGTVTVDDWGGDEVAVTLTTWRGDRPLGWLTMTTGGKTIIPAGLPPAVLGA